MNAAKQHQYGLRQARFQALWSKDPGTKVGACILRPDGTVASMGWNGFPRGVKDSEERLNDRATKLPITLHAEENAILMASESLRGYTMYSWPFQACSHCAAQMVQKGIAKVVSMQSDIPERWKADMELALQILYEGGVSVMFYSDNFLPLNEETLKNPYISAADQESRKNHPTTDLYLVVQQLTEQEIADSDAEERRSVEPDTPTNI